MEKILIGLFFLDKTCCPLEFTATGPLVQPPWQVSANGQSAAGSNKEPELQFTLIVAPLLRCPATIIVTSTAPAPFNSGIKRTFI